MADNTELDSMSGGDTYRSKDRTGIKTQIMALDLNPAGAESLMAGVLPSGGDTAHDDADGSTKPVKIGLKAVAWAATPTAVDANDRTNWHGTRGGIAFIIGGHPNIQSLRVNYTTAQTNTQIIAGVANTRIIVTAITVTADNANTASPNILIGFHSATTPTGAGCILGHPGLPGGGGVNRGDGSGILGVSASADHLLITSGAPTGGSITVIVTYFTTAA